MEQTTSQININANDGQTITLLHGEAPKQEQMWQNHIVENITPSSITDFVKKSKGLPDTDFSHALIKVSYSKYEMSFVNNVHREGRIKLSSVVKLSTDLQNFGINDDKVKFNKKSFENLLRRNKRFFADSMVHTALLKDIQNLKAKKEIAFQNSDDKRSNVSMAYNQQVMVKPFQFETFEIDIPLFQNQPDIETVPIEIYYEVGDTDISISLHSEFLYSFLDAKQKSVIDTEIARILELYPLIPVLVDA
ncbi:MAG: hypothetical protein EKK55_08545 [Rhodocyclaceae bacterium]|nr:MAG: hypothetical protein EKK55_08545 [Rhodocyclaceae bacterium]